jgi:hypothetical protein
VEITIHNQHGIEDPNSFNSVQVNFSFISSGPWIPMMPDSQEVPDLDEKWKGDAGSGTGG